MTVWLVRLDAPGDGPRLAVKDAIDLAGVPTTVGCPAISDDAAPAEHDAPVVATAREAGARIVGKTNLTELCRTADGVNPWTGTPPNPLDPDRIPGGSSSGSAVAVATGEADVGYGSDTGGSVRIPAACCGIAGLKTTRGRLSCDGLFPFSPTLDTVGPLARDVAGVEVGMRLMEPGFAVRPYEGSLAVGRLRVDDVAVDPEIDAAIDGALRVAGLDVHEVPLAGWREAVDAANLIMLAEGYVTHKYLLPRGDRMSDRVRYRIERGADVKAEEVATARGRGRAFRARLDTLFAQYAVLALPTMTGLPPRLDTRDVPLTDLTVPFNLAGLPALALPVPRGAVLPASLQLVGPARGEERLLDVGGRIESALLGSR